MIPSARQGGVAAPDRVAALAARLRRRHARLARCVDRLSVARLVTGVGALLALAASAPAGDVRLAGVGALDSLLEAAFVVLAVAFVVAVAVQRRPRERRDRVAAILAALERESVRLAGGLPDDAPDGSAHALDRGLAEDLSLVGERSLFASVARCATSAGARTLAEWLTVGEPPGDVVERQAAARALVPRLLLRHRLEAAGQRGRQRENATQRLIDRLAELPVSLHADRPWLAPVAVAWGAATWVQAIAGVAFGVPTLVVTFLVVQGVGFALLARRLAAEYATLLDHETTLTTWREALRVVERARVPSVAWQRERDVIRGRGAETASEAVRRLERILGALQARHGLIHPIVNVLVPWDLVLTARLWAWRRAHGDSVARWLGALGRLEALTSLSGHAVSLEPGAWPVIAVDGPAWTAEDLRHPLLSPERAVGNDVALVAPGDLFLVTGSNMSGKSTLLRSVGQATALALAGGAVPARGLRLRPCRLRTSIRVSDALDEGVSLFHAEVKRLRRILDDVAASGRDPEGPQVLFLLDEILRGTNTRERLAASRAVLRQLTASRSTGLVTTHDLSLVELAERHPNLTNVHFREHVEGGRMAFDYRLRPGPVETTNALEVLRLEGIEVAPEDLD